MSDQNKPPSDDEDWGPSSPWQQQQPPPPPQQAYLGQPPYPGQPPPQDQPRYPGQQYPGQQYPGQHYPGPQQPPPQQFQPGARVQNYLVWAIISILLCIPTGIVAMVYSTQVNTKLSAGDLAGATKASNNAKIWCIVSTVLGVVGTLVYLASLGSTA
jgi:Interferon-induced transmembrane protein